MFAIDVDGDGEIDVLSASYWRRQDRLVTNRAELNFSGPFIDVSIASSVDSLSTSRVRPTRRTGQLPCRYENHGNAGCSNNGASCSEDSDCSTGNTCVLASFEDGTGLPSTRVITTSANTAKAVVAVDVDGDGHIDVISAAKSVSGGGNGISWYRSDGAQPPTFTGYVIDAEPDDALAVLGVDINGDEHVDVVVAENADNRITMWTSNGAANTPTFTEAISQAGCSGVMDIFAVDMDGNGIMDVLTAEETSDSIAWHTGVPDGSVRCSTTRGTTCSADADPTIT